MDNGFGALYCILKTNYDDIKFEIFLKLFCLMINYYLFWGCESFKMWYNLH